MAPAHPVEPLAKRAGVPSLAPDMSTPRALIIETSTPEGSIALVSGGGFCEQRTFGSDRRHNSALFGPLRELMNGVEALDLVLVGSGPGSYSGTRVGIAAAQGVAIALDCPSVVIPSVLGIEPVSAGRPCLVVGDARRGTHWSARIESGIMEEPRLEPYADWKDTLREVHGEGLEMVSFEDSSGWALDPEIRVNVVVPKASWLWMAWCAAAESTRANWRRQAPQPIYLKPPHITKAVPRA